MIVRILEIGLDQVMVDVLNRDIRFDTVKPHGLQFEHHQRAGCILGQSLVDADAYFFAGCHVT